MNPYSKIKEELESKGVKVSNAANAYKILYKLATVNRIDMNGNKTQVGKEFSLSKNKIINLAKESLDIYLQTGKLFIPNEFLYRKRKQYKHDGNPEANRNLWTESSKSKNKNSNYTYNTVNK